jgi:hypothetical protein
MTDERHPPTTIFAGGGDVGAWMRTFGGRNAHHLDVPTRLRAEGCAKLVSIRARDCGPAMRACATTLRAGAHTA